MARCPRCGGKLWAELHIGNGGLEDVVLDSFPMAYDLAVVDGGTGFVTVSGTFEGCISCDRICGDVPWKVMVKVAKAMQEAGQKVLDEGECPLGR